MAPDVARDVLSEFNKSARIIDPMCGSGTVLRFAAERGHPSVGVDIDPLAVLMARVWTRHLDPFRLLHDANDVIARARNLGPSKALQPRDSETAAFVEFWFAPPQRDQLARLAGVLAAQRGSTRDALALCLSRTIVTKERGASRARDTSHSRPHRVFNEGDFDVYSSFFSAARLIGQRLEGSRIRADAEVLQGDARRLLDIPDNSFDLALTSPPYLNAIDYLRGHRLALVWLGYDLSSLRELRAASVGTERSMATAGAGHLAGAIVESPESRLNPRQRGWVARFAHDMTAVLSEMQRVVRKDGRLVLVVGNSFLRGALVDNSRLIKGIATSLGCEFLGQRERTIPARRRYLPPPTDASGSLDGRMRTEVILSFRVAR